MKQGRQQRILELISEQNIGTQEDLIRALRKEGFDVTQATISRDIRSMKLTKIATAQGGYRYVLPSELQSSQVDIGFNGFNHSVAESITHVDCSLNIVVLKTYPGMAQAVAVGIDRMDLSQILGCVAGDDTIIVVTNGVEMASEIKEKIQNMLDNL